MYFWRLHTVNQTENKLPQNTCSVKCCQMPSHDISYGTAQMHLHTCEVNTHVCMQVNIYTSDQAKFFKSRELTRELTQPCKHLFLFK